MVIHSGGTQQINGVALVLRGPFRESLISWTPVCDHILQARIAHRHGHLTVVVICASTEMTSDSIKDSFYNQLSAIIQSTSPHDNLIVLGDLNAVTGSANLGMSSVVGPFGSDTPNDNTECLHLLCGNHGHTAVGSWFRRLNIHHCIWASRDGHTKEIDHILVWRGDKCLFKSYRVFRGAECRANTDHYLVAAEVALFPYRNSVKPSRVRRYDK